MRTKHKVIWILLMFILSLYNLNLSYAQNEIPIYFPLEKGNVWYYDNPNTNIDPWNIRTISDTIRIDNIKCYIWSRGEGITEKDTIYSDASNNIYRYIQGEHHLWFDFSQDSGAVYQYSAPDVDFGPNLYTLNVHVYKNRTIETPHGILLDIVSM